MGSPTRGTDQQDDDQVSVQRSLMVSDIGSMESNKTRWHG